MAKRLNDTAAIVAIPLWDDARKIGKAGERDAFPADPNGGRAVTARRNMLFPINWNDLDQHDAQGNVSRPKAAVGREGLKSATMYMGKRIAESSVCLPKGRGYK